MSKKRNDKVSMVFLTPEPSQNFFAYSIQSKEKCLQKKRALQEKEGETAIKKDLIASIKKQVNEPKVHKKSVRAAIKQTLIPLITLNGAF